MDEVLETLGANARTRIAIVRSGLRSILEVLSKRAGSMPVPELPRDVPWNGSNGRRRKAASRLRKARGPASTTGRIRSSGRGKKRLAAAKRGTAARKGRGSKRKRASA
jgi:hypothetical protein